MFFLSTLFITFIASYYMTNVECTREKPSMPNPSNGRQKPMPQPRPSSPKTQVPQQPHQKNDEVGAQIGTPVATPSRIIKEATEGVATVSPSATVDLSDRYVGEAIRKPSRTKTKDHFIKLKNYDDNDDDDDEEMVEIEMNESDYNETEETEVVNRPKKTLTRKIKSKFKEVTNENTLLGTLIQNPTFMTAMRAGAGGFTTLAGICMMFVMLKFMKTL